MNTAVTVEDGFSLQQRLAAAPMTRAQWLSVAVCSALIALDGFDVLAVTFAAPAIGRAWHLEKSVLGWVFSAGLAGMALGSFLLAPLADRAGRRPLVLASLATMIAGTLWTALASGLTALIASRLFTGLGIGAMIAVVVPLAAEYTNLRRRTLALSLNNIGYPIGGLLGGVAAAAMLGSMGWQSLFFLASALGVGMMVLAWFTLPEPAGFLATRDGPQALPRINAYLRHCGLDPVASLPPRITAMRFPTVELFRGAMRRTTLTVTAAYFLFVITMFFMQSWLPTLVADVGFSAPQAARVALWLSIGGIAGGLFIGIASARFALRPLVCGILVLAFLLVAAFALVPAEMALLQAMAAAIGFAVFGAMIGMYAVIAHSFPIAMRASGAGFVIGLGRVGSALSPLIAGALFAGGASRGMICAILALPALAASIILFASRDTGERAA